MVNLMNAVEIERVTKKFGDHIAVDELSMSVPAGSIYGFIGPNGSGKTTTIRMIMRIMHPDSGQVRVLGEDSLESANDRIGYLPEERGLYKKMKVKDILRFYAELKSYPVTTQEVNGWLERMQLSEWGNKKVQALSKGMAQKVQFIGAVIARPSLVILDEPFSGLDPVNAEVLKDAVLGLKRDGATVIFSTHDMDVAEKMCDFIFMIFEGRKVLDGTLQEIQASYGNDTLRVRLSVNGNAAGEGQSIDLSDIAGVERVNDFGWHQELRVSRGVDTQSILTELMRRGHVKHFEQASPSLHDIFVRIAGADPNNGSKQLQAGSLRCGK
jgi:ABC-2 type transport system ATP-binding protein